MQPTSNHWHSCDSYTFLSFSFSILIIIFQVSLFLFSFQICFFVFFLNYFEFDSLSRLEILNRFFSCVSYLSF
jgi:hypothetical protein